MRLHFMFIHNFILLPISWNVWPPDNIVDISMHLPFTPQSLLYKEVEESDCRIRLANELMLYHMKVSASVFPCKPTLTYLLT